MTDDLLGPSPIHIKYIYSSYVYDGFCIWRTNFPGPIESVLSKFTCIPGREVPEPVKHVECLCGTPWIVSLQKTWFFQLCMIASTLFWSNSMDTFNGLTVLRIHF